MSDPDIDALARWALHNATEQWIETNYDLPGMSISDYDAMIDRIAELLPPDVTFAEYKTAHKVLADRAETTDG